jgi:predicted PurR-regulated permease PerM
MAVIGMLWTVALLLIGVPGALFLGFLAGLAAFVHYVGPLIALVPAFLLAFAAGPLSAVLVLVSYVAIQTVESYFITPLIMERAASLHPATVIAAAAVLGAAFGTLGVLLAVPATVAAGILVEELWFRRLEEKDAEGAA